MQNAFAYAQKAFDNAAKPYLALIPWRFFSLLFFTFNRCCRLSEMLLQISSSDWETKNVKISLPVTFSSLPRPILVSAPSLFCFLWLVVWGGGSGSVVGRRWPQHRACFDCCWDQSHFWWFAFRKCDVALLCSSRSCCCCNCYDDLLPWIFVCNSGMNWSDTAMTCQVISIHYPMWNIPCGT